MGAETKVMTQLRKRIPDNIINRLRCCGPLLWLRAVAGELLCIFGEETLC